MRAHLRVHTYARIHMRTPASTDPTVEQARFLASWFRNTPPPRRLLSVLLDDCRAAWREPEEEQDRPNVDHSTDTLPPRRIAGLCG